MKKFITTITAIVMALISVFTIVGCTVNGATDISFEEFITTYFKAMDDTASNFAYEDDEIVGVNEDFTYSELINSTSEIYNKLSFKETENGELQTKRICETNQETNEKISVSLKKIDGVIFVYATIEKRGESQNKSVEDNLLKENNTSYANVIEWYMGKNDDGYYIANIENEMQDNNGKTTILDTVKNYMYYADETTYNEDVKELLNDIYYRVKTIYFTSIDYNIFETKKIGNKLSYKTVYDYTMIGDSADMMSNEIIEYKVENDEKLSCARNSSYVDESTIADNINVVTYNKGANVKILNDFDGYVQTQLEMDIL